MKRAGIRWVSVRLSVVNGGHERDLPARAQILNEIGALIHFQALQIERPSIILQLESCPTSSKICDVSNHGGNDASIGTSDDSKLQSCILVSVA